MIQIDTSDLAKAVADADPEDMAEFFEEFWACIPAWRNEETVKEMVAKLGSKGDEFFNAVHAALGKEAQRIRRSADGFSKSSDLDVFEMAEIARKALSRPAREGE